MKVLLVHCFYRSTAPSGEDSVFIRERELLQDGGVEVHSFIKRNDDINDGTLVGQVRAAKNCIWSGSAKEDLRSVIRQVQPDIVHFHNTFPQMSLSVYEACIAEGVPFVQTLHNFRYICPNALLMRAGSPCELCIQPENLSVMPALKHRCYRDSLVATLPLALNIDVNRAKGLYHPKQGRFIALTEFARSRFMQAGFDPAQILVKPNFVFDPGLNHAPAENYALFVGRLTSEKGIQTLIAAWRHVNGLQLKVVGDGALRSTLEAQCRHENLNVEFLGLKAHQDVLAMIQRSKFVIVPSTCYEGFPAAIVESYACGKAVLASDIGSLKELVVTEQTGLKFEPGNAEDLARCVNRVQREPGLAAMMGQNARVVYLARYTPKNNLEQLMSIYRELIASKRSPSKSETAIC